ncbi:DnaJ domain-containing protein [Chloroflexi bacterium TSY]|nr:DnaJ domain-containing protein [Chloroflexi bacterium TSY]
MKDYFRVLDVPEDASTELIKTRYRQLVRIFHPDKFVGTNIDQEFVEEKLKEINVAYNALLNPEARKSAADKTELLPQPVVFPAELAFGRMRQDTTATKTFQVGNLGDKARHFDVVYAQPNAWYQITSGRRIDPARPFPMELEVTVDTSLLNRHESYTGWIDLMMDNTRARVNISVDVGYIVPLPSMSIRMVTMTLLLGLVLGGISTQIFRSIFNRPFTDATVSASSDFSQEPAQVDSSVQVETVANGAPAPIVVPTAQLVVPTLASSAAVLDDGVNDRLNDQPEKQSTSANASTSMLAIDTATPQATPTDELVVTPTRIPTKVIEPTPTVISAPQSPVMPEPSTPSVLAVVPDAFNVNARSDASIESAIVGQLKSGSVLPVLGRTEDSQWLYIQLENGNKAWVFAEAVFIKLESVMVMAEE